MLNFWKWRFWRLISPDAILISLFVVAVMVGRAIGAGSETASLRSSISQVAAAPANINTRLSAIEHKLNLIDHSGPPDGARAR